jgi:hypothetical protein
MSLQDIFHEHPYQVPVFQINLIVIAQLISAQILIRVGGLLFDNVTDTFLWHDVGFDDFQFD